MVALPEGLNRVLVIKLGALGDFVQAMGPFQAIRSAFPKARITLLTTKPFVGLAEASGWFDQVWIDHRPRTPGGYFDLRRRLKSGRFEMVFDLQTSDRSSTYWHMLWPGRPLLSGIARGASHPHDNPNRDDMHTLDRQREQLALAGINQVPSPNVDWMTRTLNKPLDTVNADNLALPERYGLIVPGGSPHRPDKRWPADRFADLALAWMQAGLTPVLIGTKADAEWTRRITAACPGVIDLTDRTGLFELAGLCRSARVAVGNDTGPMHLAAVAGCPCLVLYSHASDPALCAQKGPSVQILRVADLTDLPVQSVLDALPAL